MDGKWYRINRGKLSLASLSMSKSPPLQKKISRLGQANLKNCFPFAKPFPLLSITSLNEICFNQDWRQKKH